MRGSAWKRGQTVPQGDRGVNKGDLVSMTDVLGSIARQYEKSSYTKDLTAGRIHGPRRDCKSGRNSTSGNQAKAKRFNPIGANSVLFEVVGEPRETKTPSGVARPAPFRLNGRYLMDEELDQECYVLHEWHAGIELY